MQMTDPHDAVRAILPQLAKAKGKSLRELSTAVGKNEAYLQQFVQKKSPKYLPEEIREKLAELLEVPEDVLRGKRKITKRELSQMTSSDAVEWTLGSETYLPIRVFDIRAAAGAGALIEDGEPTSHQFFRHGFLRRLSKAPLEKLNVITVGGDSMEPTLRSGDEVLVDMSETKIIVDGIYILLLDDDRLMVKRCQIDHADGSLLILSDNPHYKPIKVGKGSNIRALGRVILATRVIG
jgi:phage repressor protein C with HTH and peptisase S24 domain